MTITAAKPSDSEISKTSPDVAALQSIIEDVYRRLKKEGCMCTYACEYILSDAIEAWGGVPYEHE